MIYTAEKKEIGKVKYWFSNKSVIGFETKESIAVGDIIRITGEGGEIDFTQTVESMQIDHEPIQEAKAGDLVGIKVVEEASPGCCVFKI